MRGTGHARARVENPCVSIIIPIYNVERYLAQCLDSVVAQTLTEIEIICIDDGSTDSSSAILHDYAARDPRITVVTQENHGYGYALNRGIEQAVGDYVGIVESDDWVDPTMFAKLCQAARFAHADMAKCNYYKEWTKVKPRRELYRTFTRNDDGHVISPRRFNDGALLRRDPAVWSAIYRRSFLHDNHIRCLETPGASFQDASFNFKALYLAERLVCVATPYVHYRQDNEASSINSTAKAYCVCDEYEEIERFLASLPEPDPDVENLFPLMLYDTFIWNYKRLDPTLKLPFLEVASHWFRRLLDEGKVEWSRFSEYKRLSFRMIAYTPMTYHSWRQQESTQQGDSMTTKHHRLISTTRKWIQAIVPPSRTNFTIRMRALTRQLEAQQDMLDELSQQVKALAELVQNEHKGL